MQKFSNVQHKTQIAYMMINCKSGYEKQVLERISELAEIKEICGTVGNYDIIIKIESESIEQLQEVISMKIRHIPQIVATTTLLCTSQSSY